MILQLFSFFLFSFSISPYFQVERSLIKYNNEDTIHYTWEYIQQDDISLGTILQEKYLWVNASIDNPWYKDIKFLPYFNITTGARWKNFSGYVGYRLPIKKENQLRESNTIYAGINYLHKLSNFKMVFDLQFRRQYTSYLSSFFPFPIVDTTIINTIFSTKLAYGYKCYNPFLFFSLGKRSNTAPFSFQAGLGIALWNLSSTNTRFAKLIYHSYYYVLKPNIYLYPVYPCSIKVMLKPDGNILVSDPPYKNGWNIFAFPDGSIENTLGYLFYEARINETKIKNEGWCVKKNEIIPFFYKTLSSYGFNEKEINDFVSYWKDHLHNSPYYIINPVVNKEVDRVCPLIVSPKPDAILRVWFFIESVEYPLSLKPPYISFFKRSGFVICEWGVIIVRK